MKLPEFDSTKEFETFHNFEGNVHIIKIDTENPANYLARMSTWYSELEQYTDLNGSHKVIQVYFKLPPLSAIMKFIEMPFPQNFKWSPVAIIHPKNVVVDKFLPVINWAANLNKNRDRVTVRFFSSEYLEDVEPVVKWLNDQVIKRYGAN